MAVVVLVSGKLDVPGTERLREQSRVNETELSHSVYGLFVPSLRRNLGEFNES